MFSKVKILIVGPTESGKSVISNFLADATESTGGAYHPTQGVRILEFESDSVDGHSESLEVELWDCSGDQRYLHFAKEQGLRDKQCMVMAHTKPGQANARKVQLQGGMSRIRCVETNVDEEPDDVREAFNTFLTAVMDMVTDKREQEELSIIE